MHDLNTYIDHTLLHPLATIPDLIKCIDEVKQYAFKGLCLSPYHWHYVLSKRIPVDALRAVVIGFPHGNEPTTVKQRAMEDLVSRVDEFDIVLNLQALKARDWDVLFREIERLSAFCKINDRKDKWIIESGMLNQTELEKICAMMNEVSVAFVKTSTGFNGSGAHFGDVALMRKLLKETIEIKASGGIHSLQEAQGYIDLGATRLGMSKSVEVMKAWQKERS